jgi:hypothetical protein
MRFNDAAFAAPVATTTADHGLVDDDRANTDVGRVHAVRDRPERREHGRNDVRSFCGHLRGVGVRHVVARQLLARTHLPELASGSWGAGDTGLRQLRRNPFPVEVNIQAVSVSASGHDIRLHLNYFLSGGGLAAVVGQVYRQDSRLRASNWLPESASSRTEFLQPFAGVERGQFIERSGSYAAPIARGDVPRAVGERRPGRCD